MKLISGLVIIFFLSFAGISMMNQNTSVTLLETKQLAGYPSASAIQLYRGRFYIMGDDAAHLLILDQKYQTVERIRIFDNEQLRIPKSVKADLEASAVIDYEGQPHLLLCGSGARKPRENVILVPLDGSGKFQMISYSPFLKKIKTEIKDINIEGCAAYKEKLILSNRANLSTKRNQLIITEKDFFLNKNAGFKIIPVELKTGLVIGISSLSYSKEKDWLLFTATTEDTKSSYDDGAIGDSYLGIIKNFSSKENNASVSADELINLSAALPEMKQQKIEGLTTEESGKKEMLLHLVSDNDNGESRLYKIRFKFSD